MVLMCCDVVRMGLVSASALAMGARVSAAKGFHLGLVSYNVAKEWTSRRSLARARGRAGGRRVPDHPRPRRRAHADADPEVGGEEEVRRRRPPAGEPRHGLRVPLARPGVVRRNVEDCREWVSWRRTSGPGESRCGRRAARRTCRRSRPSSRSAGRSRVRGLREGARRRDLGRGPRRPDEGTRPDAADHGRLLAPERRPDLDSNDTDVVDGSVAASFALLRPFIRCCHITDLRNAYPWRALSLPRRDGLRGFHAVRVHAAGAGRRGCGLGSRLP